MTTTRQEIKNQTGIIITHQRMLAAVVATASERADVAEVATRLNTAQGLSVADVMQTGYALSEAQKENDDAQATGLAELQDILNTTNVGSNALQGTLVTMRNCAVISEAIALEDAEHAASVARSVSEHNAELTLVAQDLATGMAAMDEEAAHQA